jgi:hypothetical protein
VVLLDLSAVNSLEATAAERLNDLAETFHAQGMALWLAVPGPEPLEVIRHAGQLHGRDDLEADTGRLGSGSSCGSRMPTPPTDGWPAMSTADPGLGRLPGSSRPPAGWPTTGGPGCGATWSRP